MRRISKLFAAAALVFFACSCTEDLGPADLPVDDNRTLVTFNIRTPAPVRPATRVVDTAFESGIVNVVVLVAKDNGSGTFYLDQMIVVDEFRSSTSASAAFTVALTPDAARTKLLLVANCTSGALNTLNSFVARNYSESDLRIQLSDQLMQSVYGASGRMMTMTGEVTLESLSPAGMIDVEVPLVRFVARADVQVNLAAGSPTFEPAEMFVYNMHAFARIFPDPGAFAEPQSCQM